MAFWDVHEDTELDDELVMPTKSAPEYRLVAQTGENSNRVKATDLPDALEQYHGYKNAEALYWYLNRDVIRDDIESPAAHTHGSKDTLIRWMPLASVAFKNGLGGTNGAPNRHNGKPLVTSTTTKTLATIPVFLPAAMATEKRRFVFPRILVSPYSLVANKHPLRCIITLRGVGVGNAFSAQLSEPQTICVYQANGFSGDFWFCGEPMWISTTPTVDLSMLQVFVKLEVYVDSTSGMYPRMFQLMWKGGIG